MLYRNIQNSSNSKCPVLHPQTPHTFNCILSSQRVISSFALHTTSRTSGEKEEISDLNEYMNIRVTVA
jgi:hypothetical protein